MREKISSIINTDTFKHTGLVTSATAINGILGFIFFWLLACIFSPSILGTFTVAITAAGLITDISTIGTDTGVVNFVGRFIKTDKDKALRFLKLAFEIKVLVAIVVVILGWFLVPQIAIHIFNKQELIVPLRFSLFASVSLLLFGFSTSSLQSLQKFSVWGFVNIFANFGRLIFVYLIFIFGMLTLDSGLLVYIAIPFFAFLFSFIFLPNFLKIKNEKKVLPEFFHYNKWVAIFTLIAAVASRLDMFLVTRLRSLNDVGIYSVAVTLSGVVPQLVAALGTVVAPKLAGMETKEKAILYLKKLQFFVTMLSILGIVSGTIVGYFLIHKFYSASYFNAFPSFVILLIAQAIFLFSIPVHMAVIYYFSYPKLFVWISIVNVLIVAVGGYILISAYGFIGIAIAVLVGNVSNFIIPAIWVVKKFKK
ncbi:hypothetical protein BH10PAT1_BH10PAT1_3020 [soil metagenome]